jgi:hypothetical protein
MVRICAVGFTAGLVVGGAVAAGVCVLVGRSRAKIRYMHNGMQLCRLDREILNLRAELHAAHGGIVILNELVSLIRAHRRAFMHGTAEEFRGTMDKLSDAVGPGYVPDRRNHRNH